MTISSNPSSSVMPAAKTAGISLIDLATDAGGLTASDFSAAYGHAFLLHHRSSGPLVPAAAPRATVLHEGAHEPGDTESVLAQLDLLVFAVCHAGRSPFPNFVSVGRTDNNDIVINDVSITKFHAFFRLGDDGGCWLQDAGSRNGTFVDDEKVAARGHGEPVLVSNGARVRFGGVSLTFLTAEAVQDLVRRGL